jgi:hypothetical protein
LLCKLDRYIRKPNLELIRYSKGDGRKKETAIKRTNGQRKMDSWLKVEAAILGSYEVEWEEEDDESWLD